MKGLRLSVLIMLFSGLVAVEARGQQKYAILISGGQTDHDNAMYHSEYWYDLFLMYRMLVDNGFTHDRIFVLYGDGNDYISTHTQYQNPYSGLSQITDYPNHKSDIANLFAWLGTGNATEGIPQVTGNDFVFFWWMGHGGPTGGGGYQATIDDTPSGYYDHVSDAEFVACFAKLSPCTVRCMYVMTCYSGLLIDDFLGAHTMIHTAAPANATTCSALYTEPAGNLPHAMFTYHVGAAFQQQEPNGTPVASDTNGDTLASAGEVNVYANTNTTCSTTVVGDLLNLAPLILIANAQPDAGIPQTGIMSRDHEHDNGTVPSDYETWYHGPDLWVRHIADGLETHQNPEFGQPNHVYARLHNIGCQTVKSINVEFSWCHASAWANPAGWDPIATVPVASLDSAASTVIHTPWTTVPAPGSYCLHTVLKCASDPPNADWKAYNDNNKVQINVTVEDTFAGWDSLHLWFIENGIKEAVPVDLVIDKIRSEKATRLALRLPAEMQFKETRGGKIKRDRDGLTFELQPEAQRAVIFGIRLRPNEKKETLLQLGTSKKGEIGEEVIVRVSEQLKGRDMGGILFRTRFSSHQVVLSTLLKRLENSSRVLHRKLGVDEAREIVRASQMMSRDTRFFTPKLFLQGMQRVLEAERKMALRLERMMEPSDHQRVMAALKTATRGASEGDLNTLQKGQTELQFALRPLFLEKRR